MAKITKLPSLATIDGFKGTLDFYVYMGINCVRSWPRSPGHDRSPAVQAQWPAFSFSGFYWKHLHPEVQQAFNTMTAGFPVSGRDLFTQAFINGTTVKFNSHG